MSLSKFEEAREKLQREMEEKLKKLEQDEKKEREKRISPLLSKYVNLMEEMFGKELNDRVESLDGVKFKKTDAKKRLEDFVKTEVDTLISQSEEDEQSIQGVRPPKDDNKNTEQAAGEDSAKDENAA